MSDSPNEKHVDARSVLSQSYEIDYVVRIPSKQITKRTLEEIRQAVLKAKAEIAPSEDRQKLMERAIAKLL